MLISGVVASALLIGAFITLLLVGFVLTKIDHDRESTRFEP